MGSNLVIAAIPDENDRVWKVSSEKIPHMTLLFLGDVDKVQNLDQIMLFVEHAANTTLKRFYLPVDRRGELGADQADVLFFKKDRYDYKAVRDFRAALLQDDNIRTAYDSSTQFEGPWTPHLTLGYPAAPAKPLDDSFSFFDVQFIKIAVWTGDFEGPDFLLKDHWDEMDALDAVPMDVAMSDIHHYGVKGQKWGVRKETDAQTYLRIGDTPQDRKDARRDARWLKKNHGVDGPYMAKSDRKIFGAAQKTLKPEVKALNKSPEFSGKENRKQLKDPTSSLAARYDKAHTELFVQHMKAAVEKHGKTSPSGKWEEKVSVGKDGSWYVGIKKTEQTVRHAAMTDMDYEFFVQPVRDADRLIVDYQMIEIVEDASMTQTSELGEEFLSHHGVKGMRWGVTTAKKAGSGVKKAAGSTKRFVKDVSFESRAEDGKAREMVVNAAAKPFRKEDLPAVKARHGDYGKLTNRAKKPFSPEAKAYRKDARETYVKRLESTANSMKNASGDRQYTIRERGHDLPAEGGALPTSKTYWDVSSRRIKHAPEDDFTRLEIIFDEEGWITDLKPVTVENSVTQTVDLGAEFLSHYGIKGMHWGVRRQGELTTQTHIDSGVFRRQTKVEAKGGEAHPASNDAIKAAVQKQKLKKSGTAALSNQELRDLQTRLQLEAQVGMLVTKKGQKFVSKQLEEEGKQQFKRGVGTGVRKAAPHVVKKARRGAATAAVAALL